MKQLFTDLKKEVFNSIIFFVCMVRDYSDFYKTILFFVGKGVGYSVVVLFKFKDNILRVSNEELNSVLLNFWHFQLTDCIKTRQVIVNSNENNM